MNQEKRNYFIDLLDDFLDGKPEQSKQSEIKKALTEDASLKELLEHHVEARANIRLAAETELKNNFAKSFEVAPEPAQSISNFPKYLILLLLLLGLAAAGYYFLNANDTSPSEKIYANALLLENIEDPSYDLLRTEPQSTSSWAAAVKSFFDKDYQSTLSYLTEIATEQPPFIADHPGKYALMKGVCHLKLEQFEAAQNTLAKISPANPYYDQAEWYQALTWYYSGDIAKAKSAFTKISNKPDHYKKLEAEQFLSVSNDK